MPPITSNRAPRRSVSGSAATDAGRDDAALSGPIADTELDGLFAALDPFAVLILAVSGGADSVAMMHLVARWAQRHRNPTRTILVATVDHGLREDSAREADWVADAARSLGLAHQTLQWLLNQDQILF